MGFWGVKRGIKRRQSDILFSKLVRKERNYTCEKCGKRHEENSFNLGLSHFWPRNNQTTRYDRQNVDSLCNIPCHNFFEGNRERYIEWKKRKLGEKVYDVLEFRAHQTGKWDKFIEKLLCKQLREELNPPPTERLGCHNNR